ncbi:MAG: PBP1A family penicillin-binding protein [Candidatus Paceibacterota bacterium]
MTKTWRKRLNTGQLVKALGMLFLWFFVIGSIIFLSLFLYLQRTLPDPETIANRKVGESTKIYDRTGETLLFSIHGEEKRTVIPWEKIPESVKKATLATEDSNFYNHKGLDMRGIIRAFFRNLKNLEISEGGSTITQQLVKKALLGDERTISRKIKELIYSIEIERRFSKDQILWMYLNQIPYGSNLYGIEEASKTFFGKPALELTNTEAAIIAALIKAPSYYSPYGNNVPELLARKDFVLARMQTLNLISEEEYVTAKEQELEFKKSTEKLVAPHFVIMVKEYLTSKYGEGIVESGGFRVITTLDANLQSLAEEVVGKYAKINKEKYKASNAAMVSIDPKNGEVLALVGSANYFDIENEGNFNVTTAKRQPGSSFKPFAYATALQKGYTDYTALFDLKTEFNFNCSPDASQKTDRFGANCYHPQNYDGLYRGPVTLRQALSQSLNVPSVKTLYLAGISDTIDLAEKMGITTLQERERFGLSLVLGGAEVKLVDITSAYGVFAADGVRNPWSFIQKIESANGSILEEKKDEPKRVLDTQTARMINNILSDNSTRAPVFGYSSSLYIAGRDVAAKTGTTQENRDAWVIGYSPNLVTGVWTGNNRQESMTQQGAGISAAGPMWHEFMAKALASYPNDRFENPAPLSANKAMLDGNYIYNRGGSSSPEYHSILFYVNKDDPQGPFPSDPNQDIQFNNWEWSVQNNFNRPL